MEAIPHPVQVDPWECDQDEWTRTAIVLQRFADELAKVPVQVGAEGPATGIIKVRS